MINFFKIVIMVILVGCLPVGLAAQAECLLQLAPDHQVVVQSDSFSTGMLIVDPYDFPFRAEVTFTVLYDPQLVMLDTEQGAPESPGLEDSSSLTIDEVDNSIPGRLAVAVTLVNHMEFLTIYWQTVGNGKNTFEIEPGPDNAYYSTSGSQVVVLPRVPGDVDNNRSIDIIDALQIARASVGLRPEDLSPTTADVDGDGLIGIIDALMVAQYYVGLIPGFPVGVPELQQVLFINLEKEAGPLDDYGFTQLGEVSLTLPDVIVLENSCFILPQNSETFVDQRLFLTEIENGTLLVTYEWNTDFSWSAEDKAAGRIIMDGDKVLTVYYYTVAL